MKCGSQGFLSTFSHIKTFRNYLIIIVLSKKAFILGLRCSQFVFNFETQVRLWSSLRTLFQSNMYGVESYIGGPAIHQRSSSRSIHFLWSHLCQQHNVYPRAPQRASFMCRRSRGDPFTCRVNYSGVRSRFHGCAPRLLPALAQ